MVCGWVGRWSHTLLQFVGKDGDTDLDVTRKAVSLISACISLAITPAIWMSYNNESMCKYLTALFSGGAGLLLLSYVLIVKSAPARLLEVVGYGWMMATLISSYAGSRTGTPMQWPFIIIVLDVLLISRCDKATSTILWCTAPAMVVIVVTNMAGFDFPDIVEYKHVCDCDQPPCRPPNRQVMTLAIQNLCVMFVDFYLTRGFAQGVLQEQAAMQLTVSTMGEIAMRLAEYDVDSVMGILDRRHAELPEDVAAALRTLAMNLQLYRPYLPDALFEKLRMRPSVTSLQPPPGLSTQEVAIVFTDIRASTSIWEMVPEAMKKAMRVHYSVIRDVIEACSGYEVKTVGDAFMVAFESLVDGVNFGLRVHTALLAAEWPQDLSDIDICAPRNGLWGGLTVRIGINAGPITMEQTQLTHRADYFGHTVNVAARLESVCSPGAVALPTDLWDKVCTECDPAVAGPVEAAMLKGIQSPVMMYCVWPAALRSRRVLPLQRDLLQVSPVHSGSMSGSTRSMSVFQRLNGPLEKTIATLGVVHFAIDNAEDVGLHLSHYLSAMSVTLTRNSGTVVSLLGNSVTVGWNVARRHESHAESALAFASNLDKGPCHLGLASGAVQHGDVGYSTQRFVTVVGEPVRTAWALSTSAMDQNHHCLYVWVQSKEDFPLPQSVLERVSPLKVHIPGLQTAPQVYYLTSG